VLPDIDSLALFVRAAELHSLTKAADASHIGLAAASRRIALLEHRFKTALLDRSPQGVKPTPAGEALLPHAKALLREINQMQAEMWDHADGRKGALRVQANTSAMTESLPADLAAFQRANPDIRLTLQERWSSEIVNALRVGETDVGIVLEGVKTDDLDTRVYRTDRIAVIMPATHPLANASAMTFADVLNERLVALESSASMMRLLSEQAVIEERPLQLRVQVRSFEAEYRMVQVGFGLGVLPFESASVIGDALGLVVRPLTESWAERNMLVCVKKNRSANTSVAKLVDHLVTTHGQMSGAKGN